MLITVLAVGAGSGIIASVMTLRSLDNYAQSLLNTGRFTAMAPLKAVTAPGTYEDSLARVRESSLRALAIFLPKSADTSLPASFVKMENAKGEGVVVSADGWVLTTSFVLPDAAEVSQIDVWVEEQRYAIDSVVRDSSTPLVLLKLKDASALPTVGFAAAGDIESGEMLFGIMGLSGIQPTVLTASDYEVVFGVGKAEIFATEWRIAENIKDGQPIFASTGDLAGFALGDFRAFPLHHSSSFVQDIVRTGAVHRAALGAYVVDLSRTYNLASALRQGRYDGALVLAPNISARATVKGGPADKAGIVSGDILLDADGVSVTSANTLAEILAEYKPGEIANVRLLRGGQTVTVPVTLGDAKDLVY